MISLRIVLAFCLLAYTALSMVACSKNSPDQEADILGRTAAMIDYSGKGTYTVDISGEELRISINAVPGQEDKSSHLFTFELEGWDSQECKLYRISGDSRIEVPLMNLPLIQFEAQPGEYIVIR